MIKFLHTADLHLGKIFHEQSLLEDQAFMLDQIAAILDDESYSALLIAGDVYDRSIPSPEAVALFGSFLGKLKALKHSPEIIVVPGNHDSAARLGFGRELFARLGVHFGVSAADCNKPVIIKKDGQSCAFFLLPFLNTGSLEGKDPASGEAIPLRSQSALAEEACRRMEKARVELSGKGVTFSVLVSHLFASGGVEAGSERLFIGNAEQVNAALFKNFTYTALGHLHRCQRAGFDSVWYSGSPLAYSFAEAFTEDDLRITDARGKFLLSVCMDEETAEIEKIPVRPLRKLSGFSGPFARFSGNISDDPPLAAAADDYLEIRLTDRGITENARDVLRKRFPRLLSLRQDEALAGLSSQLAVSASASESSGERHDIQNDFKKFLANLYGTEDNDGMNSELSAEIELFNALFAEAEAEEIQL